VYRVGQALGISLEALDIPAASIELIHCYSLVHDDLPAMDNDDLRRGVPTCHRAFDEATAILVGDALQGLAFEHLSQPNAYFSAEQSLAMVHTLAQAAGATGMVGGQALDLAATAQTLSLDELYILHRRKTGDLFRAAIDLAMIAANQFTEQNLCQALHEYGDAMGLAFQIQDDVLEAMGETEILGKSTGSDIANQKSTFPSVLGLEAAQAKVTEWYTIAQQALHRLPPDLNRTLMAFIQKLRNRHF
jgi:geranylgeranyl pyrophosphate synthase